MMRLILCLIIFSALIANPFSQVFPQGDEFSEEGWSFGFGGYYKNLFMYQERDEFYRRFYTPPQKKRMISDMNRLRLSPELNYADSFTLHGDFDIEAVSTNYDDSDEFDRLWRGSDYNDIVKPEAGIYDRENFYSRARVQNLYGKFVAGRFTGTAGRQQVRFGSSRLWNPLDLMNPFSPLSVEGADEQKGTDAFRLDWYPGESTELACVAAPKRENDRLDETSMGSGNWIARFKTGVKVFDAAILGGYTAKRKNAGADFAAEVNDGLLTGVFLYSDPARGRSFWQCGTGYEYTFSSGIYLLIEYFYNSLPVNGDNDLRMALLHYSVSGVDESNYYIISNRMITYNRHYCSAAAGYDFHPLLRGEIFSIYDFQGKGVFINASMKLNAMENLDVTAGAITAFVSRRGSPSDFEVYDREPLCYASMQFYF